MQEKFSIREGYEKRKEAIQVHEMDYELRVDLYNLYFHLPHVRI